MYYLTVVLPSVVVTVIYFIMFFTHARMRSAKILSKYISSLVVFLSILSMQLSVFFAVEIFKPNELLSGCFLQLFLFLIGNYLLTVFNSEKDAVKVSLEKEKARSFIRGLSMQKDVKNSKISDLSKYENGSVLPHREGDNSTKGGFDFVGAKELTLSAKEKSTTSTDRSNAIKAEQILDKAQKGGGVQKREIENAVDSLLKIVSSKK